MLSGVVDYMVGMTKSKVPRIEPWKDTTKIGIGPTQSTVLRGKLTVRL